MTVTDKARVLVTGVRGKTGVPLAGLLADRGVEVLGGSTDPTSVELPGVRPTAFSWDDLDGWPAALRDVDAVYVVRPDRPDAPELVGALVDRSAPSTRIVLLSERDAESPGPDGWASRVERVVRESGRAWSILRPGWFMQVLTDERFFLGDVTVRGELPFPSSGADLAWIDARDIAAVAERALLDDDLVGEVLELTGPASLSLPRTAQLLAAALGHPVTHREISQDEGVADLTGFDRELTALTYERVAAGLFAPVTDTVERVTGRPARPLETFLAETTPTLGGDESRTGAPRAS